MQNFPDPAHSTGVDSLLVLGEPSATSDVDWADYRSLGIGPQDAPALIAIAVDPALHAISDERDPRGWAPVHAWRALAQLRAVEAIAPLLRMLSEVKDNDWVIEEMPDVFARIGPAAFHPLAAYLGDESRPLYARLVASTALMELGLAFPELRDGCVAAIAGPLADWARNSAGTNGVLIANLVELGAAEHAALILKIFTAGQVDRFIVGDWRDIQARLKNPESSPPPDASAGKPAPRGEGQRARPYPSPEPRPRSTPPR